MQRKLNDEFIREYSEEFSEKISQPYFASHQSINGKDILNFTPSRQVNLFVLKILFRKWQEEMKQLESPYFNYKSTEVRKAMVQFMNILSQHIEVDQDHLKPMLEEAVADTILLAADPGAYLMFEFEDKDISVINEKISKPIYKYIKLHKDLIGEFFEENEGASLDDFIDAAEDSFVDIDTEDIIAQELKSLSEVIPITFEDVFADLDHDDDDDEFRGFGEDMMQEIAEEEKASPVKYEDQDDDTSFAEDDSFLDEEHEEAQAEEDDDEFDIPAPVRKPEMMFVKVQEEPEELDEPEDFEEEQEEKIVVPPVVSKPIFETRIPEPPKPRVELVREDEPEEIESTQATINDSFSKSEAPTLADRLEKKKVNFIMEAISVNHRYMFTKELFDGDRDAFVSAVDRLESCESFDDAVELLVQNYAKQRSWDMNSEEVKELLKVVFRKFR